MKTEPRRALNQVLFLLITMVVTLVYTGPGYSQDEPDKPAGVTTDINPQTYPKLTGKNMGHVRHMVEIAEQLSGNWDHMGIREEGQDFFNAYRYQLAFMTYALGITQHQKTPAYRELYQRAISRMIDKMKRREVWDYWEKMSEFSDYAAHIRSAEEGWTDPLAQKNIMYSGHLLQMVGIYSVLFNDAKYDQSGSLTLHNRPFFYPETKREEYDYDHSSLAELIHKQLVDSAYLGVECEPNGVYNACNQHPILGLIHYDQSHGTSLSSIMPAYRESLEKRLIHHETKQHMYYYRGQQDEVVQVADALDTNDPYPAINAWPGGMMNAWARDLTREVYAVHSKVDLPMLMDGSMAGFADYMIDVHFGFYAAYASEVGDVEASQKMLDYADANFKPEWKDGRYFYPRNDLVEEALADTQGRHIPGSDEHRVGRLTGNALLAMARLNDGDGFWKLYNEPWDEEFFAQPYITGVQYPDVLVEQAVFDQEKSSLIVTIAPGTNYRGESSFMVQNITPNSIAVIYENGMEIARLENGKVSSGEKTSSKVSWLAESGVLEIEPRIEAPKTFIIHVPSHNVATEYAVEHAIESEGFVATNTMKYPQASLESPGR